MKRSRRGGDQLRHLRRLPWSRTAWFYAAVGCLFSTFGFLVDLGHITRLAPWSAVLIMAAGSGLVACLYVLAIVHQRFLIPVVVAAQIGLVFLADRFLLPGPDPHVHPPALHAIQSQAVFDALGCLAAVIASYVLFFIFISREGVRQVRLDTEIGLAREIHERLVPPFARRVDGFELMGRSIPSSEVGGDLVDAFEVDSALLAIVADVSGHGVPAETLMAMVRAAVRARAAAGDSLEQTFAAVDRLLADLDRPDKFATAAALRLKRDGTAEALLAGHHPIVIVRAGARVAEHLENARPPLGIPSAMAAREIRYRPGDLFAIFTDGFMEVADRGGHMLGLEAIEALLLERSSAPLEEIAEAVVGLARRHGPITDDQTILLVRAM